MIAAIIASRIKLEEDVVLISFTAAFIQQYSKWEGQCKDSVCARPRVGFKRETAADFELQATANIQNRVFVFVFSQHQAEIFGSI